MSIWVLVADSARARILEAENSKSPFVEKADYVNTSARQKLQDLDSDRAGFHSDASMGGQHRMPQKLTHRQINTRLFAKDVAECLEQGVQHDDFNRLYIVAPPKFLGILRSQLSDQVKPKVAGEINRDISRLRPEEIRKMLPKRL